jgi:hypothetical protein
MFTAAHTPEASVQHKQRAQDPLAGVDAPLQMMSAEGAEQGSEGGSVQRSEDEGADVQAKAGEVFGHYAEAPVQRKEEEGQRSAEDERKFQWYMKWDKNVLLRELELEKVNASKSGPKQKYHEHLCKLITEVIQARHLIPIASGKDAEAVADQ